MFSSPVPYPSINLIESDAILHQSHYHPQTLHIPIPPLIIKEQHVLIRNTTRLVQLSEVQSFISRENLSKREKFDSALRWSLGWSYMKQIQ